MRFASHYRDPDPPAQDYPVFPAANDAYPGTGRVRCSWEPLKAQLLEQWDRLSPGELEEAGPYRARLALLIQRKYGIASGLVENYLRNFERTMPAMEA